LVSPLRDADDLELVADARAADSAEDAGVVALLAFDEDNKPGWP
jgi:hypothetical protein